ncbi:MAG: GNAT family N-acetyltransferase [Verrucomicrobiae bacterium]|nr:GNAT family N-acetyltransferase [Verrucomicrobiae bacterium]
MRPTTRIPGVIIRAMMIDDYEQCAELWSHAKEVKEYSVSDSRSRIDLFLRMNPDTCFVADADGQIIGTILGGFDGRRAYIYHLVVGREMHGHLVGCCLLEKTLVAMRRKGVEKVYVFVPVKHNLHGIAFWESQRWEKRPDLRMMSLQLGGQIPVPLEKSKTGTTRIRV